MSSTWRILVTVTVMYAVSRAYSVVVTPFTIPVVAIPVSEEIERSESQLPTNSGKVAESYLPKLAWAADAQYSLKMGHNSFVYFDKHLRIEDDRQNRVRLSPFAMVWFDPRRNDNVPYTLTAETAVVEFEKMFQLGSSNPGRIVAGKLNGKVSITGPDGLGLRSDDVTLSEQDGRLYTTSRVEFAYGPAEGQSDQVKGYADSIDITLITGIDSMLGDDMPRIGGIQRIMLLNNVFVDLVVDEHGRPSPATIRCDGQFAYDVENLVAILEENVDVSRPTHSPGEAAQHDRLRCDLLELSFEERPPKNGGVALISGEETGATIQTVSGTSSSRSRSKAGLNLDLQLRALRAQGAEVLLTSDENELEGWMQELRYDVPNRTLHLYHDERVTLRHELDVLACPDIEMTHDADNRIQTATCLGTGQAGRLDAETEADDYKFEVESSWTEKLILRPETETGLTLLEMTGEARVIQRAQQSGVVGDVLSVWMDSAELQRAQRNSQRSHQLPLRRVIAEQTGDDPVAMISPSLHLDTKRLVVDFEEPDATSTGSSNGRGGGLLSRGTETEEDESPVIVSAGEVTAVMSLDPDTQKTDISRIDASENVSIRRVDDARGEANDPNLDGPFSIDCDRLVVLNQPDGHVLRLQGQPARIVLPREDNIEGNDILFDRANNRAEVVGPGKITIHVDEDLDGKPLDVPQPLSVRWLNHMTFDGQEAMFTGETETTLSESVLNCEELHVGLNRKLDFSADHPDTANLQLEAVHGLHNVYVEFHEWAERTLIGIRKMEVAEFEFHRTSGEFRAKGKGTIYDWQKGNGRNPIAIGPSAESKANGTVKDSKLPWNFTQLDFMGDLKGNQIERYVILEDRVEVMHAPVEHALDVFERREINDPTESAKNSVWLGSDRMQFMLVPAQSADTEDFLQVTAFGNAEVEGQSFGASGHSISYDQSKEQFTLRGGPTDAHIWQQDSLGSAPRSQQAEVIQFIPSKQLIIEGGRSLNISQ
ncbi:MAG: hypothetical protein R3C02_18330 [Planctomycetaceae bacterium]